MTWILLVDDHPLFLDGVRAALSGDDDLEVVVAAHGVAEAIELAGRLQPGVVPMDLNLPDGSGIDATRAVPRERAAVRVLVMTMSADDDAVVAAMRAGARGYVVEGAGKADLLQAVHTGRSRRCGAQADVQELLLSDKTVPDHASDILDEIDVPGRSEAVDRDRRAGLGG